LADCLSAGDVDLGALLDKPPGRANPIRLLPPVMTAILPCNLEIAFCLFPKADPGMGHGG